MNSLRFAELETAIRCGELDCLKSCCGRLEYVARVLEGLTPRDIKLLEKMLCGCAVQPTVPGGPPVNDPLVGCLNTITDWVRQNESIINGLQNVLQLVGLTGIPAVDQAVGVALLALEQLEDAASRPTNTTLEDTAKMACTAINKLEDFRLEMINLAPQILQPAIDLISSLSIPNLIARSCCQRTAPVPTVPTTPTTPTVPDVPVPPPTVIPIPTTPTGTTPIDTLFPTTPPVVKKELWWWFCPQSATVSQTRVAFAGESTRIEGGPHIPPTTVPAPPLPYGCVLLPAPSSVILPLAFNEFGNQFGTSESINK